MICLFDLCMFLFGMWFYEMSSNSPWDAQCITEWQGIPYRAKIQIKSNHTDVDHSHNLNFWAGTLRTRIHWPFCCIRSPDMETPPIEAVCNGSTMAPFDDRKKPSASLIFWKLPIRNSSATGQELDLQVGEANSLIYQLEPIINGLSCSLLVCCNHCFFEIWKVPKPK